MFRELKWSCNRKKEKRKKPERKWHTVDIQFCKTMQRQTGGVHWFDDSIGRNRSSTAGKGPAGASCLAFSFRKG